MAPPLLLPAVAELLHERVRGGGVVEGSGLERARHVLSGQAEALVDAAEELGVGLPKLGREEG